jgi:hypothetical protein
MVPRLLRLLWRPQSRTGGWRENGTVAAGIPLGARLPPKSGLGRARAARRSNGRAREGLRRRVATAT